jgi:guanylate cyclase
MTEMRDSGVVAFVGPDINCYNEALMAAAWNIPMIAYVCKRSIVGRRSELRGGTLSAKKVVLS